MTETPDTNNPSGKGFAAIPSFEGVTEGNWEWRRAEGFRPLDTLPQKELEYEEYRKYAARYGGDNVAEGDVYDAESDRPLRNIPGLTVYVRGPVAELEEERKRRESGESRA